MFQFQGFGATGAAAKPAGAFPKITISPFPATVEEYINAIGLVSPEWQAYFLSHLAVAKVQFIIGKRSGGAAAPIPDIPYIPPDIPPGSDELELPPGPTPPLPTSKPSTPLPGVWWSPFPTTVEEYIAGIGMTDPAWGAYFASHPAIAKLQFQQVKQTQKVPVTPKPPVKQITSTGGGLTPETLTGLKPITDDGISTLGPSVGLPIGETIQEAGMSPVLMIGIAMIALSMLIPKKSKRRE